MSESDVQHRLLAILAADMAGYSRLMSLDERATLTALESARSVFKTRIETHRGHVIDTAGDSVLAVFESASGAVNAALEIQTEVERLTGATPTDRRMQFRIGVHLGDVIQKADGSVYGDGVNIAARLQGLAEAGGLAVSDSVYKAVRGKVMATFVDQGEQKVKNIPHSVRAFAVQPGGQAAATVAPANTRIELRSRDKPSIAVLPFNNMSGDPEQEYFSDGITEDIITDLSKVSALWVAARNTTFTFKGRHVDAPQIARQLNVSHLLEGSVRKAGGRVRITAQLVDATTGGHLWAERYDRDLNDIFALQDEISEAIVSALRLKLLPEEKRAIEQRGTTNPEAYKLYLMARNYYFTGNRGNGRQNETIIRLCRSAIETDPNYARPWALMACVQMNLRLMLNAPGEDGLAAAERALSLDPNLAEAHAAKARALTRRGRYDEALREIEIALRLDPDSYEVNEAAAGWHYSQRRFGEAISYWEKAVALVETASASALLSCYKAVGDADGARRAAQRALERAEKSVAMEPDNGSAISHMVAALAALGETKRAKEWAERALQLDPDNLNLRYNFACTLVLELHEHEAALDLLEPLLTKAVVEAVNWIKFDPDLDAIRAHPRFMAMLAAAEARLADSTG